MEKIKVVTDSNSGMSIAEAEKLGVSLVPMPFYIDGEEYFEELTLSKDRFFELLKDDKADIHTSQPSGEYLTELWDGLLKEGYDKILFIPMTSGMSSTCSSAGLVAADYNGKVLVVDNTRISVTQKESVYEALSMIEAGKSAEEIKEHLEKTGSRNSIYIMLDTLKYLKKGGRITPAAAALGTALRLKPILYSDGGSFDKFAMPLSVVQAKRKMIDALKKDIEGKFREEYEKGTLVVSVAHTRNFENALKFKEEITEAFPDLKFRFVDELSLSVSCHIGPGALACALTANEYVK